MKNTKFLSLSILLAVLPSAAWAAGSKNRVLDWAFSNFPMLLAGLIILGVFALLWNTMETMVQEQKNRFLRENGVEPKPVVKKEGSFLGRAYQKALSMVPVDREADIELDHDYDGIHELDNSLPPWWLYMFYFTIAFGAVYLYIFHFSDIGQSNREEYYETMEIADRERRLFLFEQANKVNENTVVALTDPSSIAQGEQIFHNLCSSCHGKLGEGMAGLGPNMTDKYWLHGGSIGNIFSTIKYGVPEKGMISWKSQLSPLAMQHVASYLLTLQGTNPPNPKAPQGELYEPEKAGE